VKGASESRRCSLLPLYFSLFTFHSLHCHRLSMFFCNF